ncbi:protein FAR1-related sequence 5 [Tanacetum coccineum]
MNEKRTTENVKRRCIKRTRCKAMIQVKLSHDEKWVVEKFLDEHNHPFDIPSHVPRQWSHKSFHRSKECKDLVTLLSKEGIRPSEITKVVNAYRGNHKDKLTSVPCSSIVSGERRRNLGKECHGVIMHFKKRAEVDKDFYFATDLSTDVTLRNLFWADDYEAKWEELKEKYHIDDDCWLVNMYKLRHRWIKSYLKDTFFAGMTTSGRSESIHSFFDGFVNSKTMLNDFVVQYDKAVNSRRSAEGEQDFRTLDSKPT